MKKTDVTCDTLFSLLGGHLNIWLVSDKTWSQILIAEGIPASPVNVVCLFLVKLRFGKLTVCELDKSQLNR